MKRISLIILFLYSIIQVSAQKLDSLCMQQLLVIGNMQAYHIEPPVFNKETNLQIMDLFLSKVDGRGLFLLNSDREKIRSLITENSANDGYCDVINTCYLIFKNRSKQLDSMLLLIEGKPFVYNGKDSVTFIPKKGARFYCDNLSDLRTRLDKRLKLDCLDYITKPAKEGEDVLKLSDTEMTAKQTEAKRRAIQRLKRQLDFYKDETNLKHHIGDCMSNSIALRCDPHSSYFNVYEKQVWDEALSGKEMSFGFYVGENETGEIAISDLIPGGPAWKSNEIHEGDVLLAFQFEKEKLVELATMDVSDYYVVFYQSTAKFVELTLRRKDNQIKKVSLQKEQIASQENTMNSYILSRGGSKFGYIPIPAFYSDNELDGRQGCANDVAKEIVKMKQDSIQGLILDLRYNGGGSMMEAMGLGGIFVDEGALAVYKQRNSKPSLLKDLNRGTIYDGPLLVLINGASASASEFLTATLQDYGRAIIVGSPTYGKGTAQNVLPADTNIYKSRGKKAYMNTNFGFVKVTTGKFYRVTTVSHQAKGIMPDIYIPDILEGTIDKESEEQYHLSCDSVNKKVVFNKVEELPLPFLKVKSKERLDGNYKFKEIVELRDSIIKESERSFKLALSVKEYKKYSDAQTRFTGRIKGLMELGEEVPLTVENNEFSKKLISLDDFQRKTNERATEGIKKDITLLEAFMILVDFNEYKKN